MTRILFLCVGMMINTKINNQSQMEDLLIAAVTVG
jgi:hypothetical protein